MNILFTLCGRAGSKGVRGKNARDFLDVPLVWYSMAGIKLYHSVEHFDIFTKKPIVNTLPCDDLVGQVMEWLLSGKMYGIFAMLF